MEQLGDYCEEINNSKDFETFEIINELPEYFREKSIFEEQFSKSKIEFNSVISKTINKIEIIKSLNKNNISVTPIFASDEEIIKIEDLPELALPVIDFIEEKQPDLVIAADRGGRYFGLAVFKSWRKAFPGRPFPTIDGNLHFGRLTKKELTDEEISGVIQDALVRSVQLAREDYTGTRDGVLRVMLIDDWICAGGTRDRVLEAFSRLGYEDGDNFELYTGVMCGRYANVSGNQSKPKYCEWQDDNDAAGVVYGSQSPIPQVAMTQKSKILRARLDDAVKKFSDLLKVSE